MITGLYVVYIGPHLLNDTCRLMARNRGHFTWVETFDIVVLSVGLQTSPEVVELAQNLDIKLTQGRFCDTDSFVPVASSKDGIYVCGAFQGPKDIPESVMQASAAAGAAMGRLATARNTLVKANCQDYPIQKDVFGKVPRIGVFVCH